MKKILIWEKLTDEINIYGKTDYTVLSKRWPNGCPNWGNKLWFQGLISVVDCPDNELHFRQEETIDEINSNYDLIIYPMANFFSEEHAGAMPELAKIFKKIKIPTYIIVCGAQARAYGELDDLVKKIGEPSKQFISSIYETGGEFALRGEFTKAFFEKLGFPSAGVTGCPSLFQMGSEFCVNNKKVSSNEIFPVFNGKIDLIEEGMNYYKNSVYIDQDLFGNHLFNSCYFQQNDTSLHQQAFFIRYYGKSVPQWLSQNRIKMIADMNEGSRIHGSIMTILSDIPATVLAIDTRTQEMAEFFDLPYVKGKEIKSLGVKEIEKLYYEADYTKV